MVRRWRHPPRGSLYRWWTHVEGRADSRSRSQEGAHPVFHSVELGWRGSSPPLSLHGRSGNGPADGGRSRETLGDRRGIFSKNVAHRWRLQRHSALESKPRRERAKCAFLNFSPLESSCWRRARRWHKRRPIRMWAERRRKKKFRPGISRPGRTERDSHPGKEPQRKARRSLPQNAPYATARMPKAPRLVLA